MGDETLTPGGNEQMSQPPQEEAQTGERYPAPSPLSMTPDERVAQTADTQSGALLQRILKQNVMQEPLHDLPDILKHVEQAGKDEHSISAAEIQRGIVAGLDKEQKEIDQARELVQQPGFNDAFVERFVRQLSRISSASPAGQEKQSSAAEYRTKQADASDTSAPQHNLDALKSLGQEAVRDDATSQTPQSQDPTSNQ